MVIMLVTRLLESNMLKVKLSSEIMDSVPI